MPYTEFTSLAAKQVCLGLVKRATWTGFVANIRTSSYSLQQLFATGNKLICCMTSGKTRERKSLFKSLCSNVEKQVARSCCPFSHTLTPTLILLVFWSLERLLEDHESVVDVVSSWPWDSQNKLILNNRREKYAVFRNPQVCILIRGEDVGFKKVRMFRTTPLYLLNTLNRLSLNINMHLLHTVLHTFLMVLLERFCPNNTTFHLWWSFH